MGLPRATKEPDHHPLAERARPSTSDIVTRMTSLALALHLALAGPPEEVIAPPSQPGEPAIAPAELSSERASQPTVQRPGQTQPDAGLPTYDEPAIGDPVEPGPSEPGPSESGPNEPTPDEDLPTWSEQPIGAPIEDPWDAPALEPVKLPGEPPRGVGLLAGAGVGFALVFTKQWIEQIVCTDVYCGYRGNFDRLVLLGSLGLIGGGAWLEGRHTGFMRLHHDKPQRKLLGRRAAGWTLFSLGMVGMIAEATLYMTCYDAAKGPFLEQSGFSYTCRPAASVLMMDGSATMAAVGFGLGMSAEAERKEARKGAAKLVLLPLVDRERAGLALVGRF